MGKGWGNAPKALRDKAGRYQTKICAMRIAIAQWNLRPPGELLHFPPHACCSALTSEGRTVFRPGNVYQIALSTCSATRIPHAVMCAACG
ncbi:hypothetical protein B0G69_0235 [Paraburkholderia sp. RAU2J]|nr:hypothetical protein B0G69_0235 [Paraburkholderia sp. RAU2J]